MSNVCADCIGDSYLHKQVMQDGVRAPCDFCQSDDHQTIKLEVLAKQVASVLNNFFAISTPDPDEIELIKAIEADGDQRGESVTDTIRSLINSSLELSEAIRKYLSNQQGSAGDGHSTDNWSYASNTFYEMQSIDTSDLQMSWSDFRHEILTRSRFFNQNAKSILERLFEDIDKLTTYDGKSVVRVFSQKDNFFRARKAETHESLKKILKEAPNSLGAPRVSLARAGRMNAEGISVFYGSTDEKTCIAEIRAPVGCFVICGEFTPLRELRLLDLTRLKLVYLQGSYFDAAHIELVSRTKFLKELVAEMSQPVMPGEESIDYLPTQVVAEYLCSHPDMNLDGVVFASSQVPPLTNKGSGSAKEQCLGENIVLFSRACGLQPHDIPKNSEVNITLYIGDEESPLSEVFIKEITPVKVDQEDIIDPRSSGLKRRDILDPSIQLDIERIRVMKIKSVSYQKSSFIVTRDRIDT